MHRCRHASAPSADCAPCSSGGSKAVDKWVDIGEKMGRKRTRAVRTNREGASPAGRRRAMAPEEVPMQWFIVEAANKPGEFARHADEIAQRGINLSNVVCLGIGDRGGAAFHATDEARSEERRVGKECRARWS